MNYDFYEFYGDYPQSQIVDYSGYFDIFGILLAVFSIFAFLLVLVGTGFYILKCIGLYKIACNRKMSNSFLALLPVANVYYMGKIADDIEKTMNRTSNSANRLLILSVSSFTLGAISIPFCFLFAALEYYFLMSLAFITLLVGIVIAICYWIYFFVTLYKIYKEYIPQSAVVLQVLSVVFHIYPFVLFAIRDMQSGYSKWLEKQNESDDESDKEHDFFFMPDFENEFKLDKSSLVEQYAKAQEAVEQEIRDEIIREIEAFEKECEQQEQDVETDESEESDEITE